MTQGLSQICVGMLRFWRIIDYVSRRMAKTIKG